MLRYYKGAQDAHFPRGSAGNSESRFRGLLTLSVAGVC